MNERLTMVCNECGKKLSKEKGYYRYKCKFYCIECFEKQRKVNNDNI